MNRAPAVDVRRVYKSYAVGWWHRRRSDVLKGVDLQVWPGEIFGLLGPNGAGKTTLVKVLLGIVRVSGGQAAVMGYPAGSLAARKKIGYLPENMSFPLHQNALLAMQLAGRLNGLSERVIRTRTQELLEMVGLHGRMRDPVKQYSKGMRQRLSLAQSLISDPHLLIMDEPTDGLDPIGRSEMRQLILELRQRGKTIFLNSHLLQEVELVCDKVAILSKGIIRGQGGPSELMAAALGSSSLGLRMDLRGQRSQIDTALSYAGWGEENGESQVTIKEISAERWQLMINVACQSDIDTMVDALRGADVSIEQMEKMQPTLEEVFMSVVNH
jgi:ABC-2 type transport system ATP-binding protein